MTLPEAERLDRDDPLAGFRDSFHIPNDTVYLCGNSLGLCPKPAEAMVTRQLRDWQNLGVEGHFRAADPWVSFHELFAAPLARIVGAEPVEVVAMNTLTVNLHLMLSSFYRPTTSRYKILTSHTAFPSDRYAVASQLRLRGIDDGVIISNDILETLDRRGEEIALILVDGVNYYTGEFLNLQAIAAKARSLGIAFGVDLAHAVGNVPLQLHDWGIDFAVWCSYKYLNGGPGCPGGAFIHQRHHHENLPRLAGWWGHNKQTRFQMSGEFDPIPTAEGWQLSNPPILSLAALRASLDLFDEATMNALRTKSLKLTGLLEAGLKAMRIDLEILTPADPERRGCQLSVRVPEGRVAFERLKSANIVCDWREPDVIRLAPVPLYNRFADVARCVEVLAHA